MRRRRGGGRGDGVANPTPSSLGSAALPRILGMRLLEGVQVPWLPLILLVCPWGPVLPPLPHAVGLF